MTQEQFDFLSKHPIMDGSTVLHYSDNNNTYQTHVGDMYLKNFSKITIEESNLIVVTVFINIKELDSEFDSIYNGQKIFTNTRNFDEQAEIFISNLSSLILIRHGEAVLNSLKLSTKDIKDVKR